MPKPVLNTADLQFSSIYMGGVGFQEFFVLVFCYIAFRFSQQIKRENPTRLSQAQLLLYAQYAVLVLITVCGPDSHIRLSETPSTKTQGDRFESFSD